MMGSGQTTILLVEDEPLLRKILREILETAGFAVEEADCADRAWDMICTGADFNVILTDVRMPGRMDGFDLIANVRRERGDIPAVLMSAYSDSLVNAVDDHIFFRKPFVSGELIKVLKTLAAQRA